MAGNQGRRGCLLFDWGGTLMRDFPRFDGPMFTWPRVEAVPNVKDVLAALRPGWILALATNAEASDEADIRRALEPPAWMDRQSLMLKSISITKGMLFHHPADWDIIKTIEHPQR